MSNTSFGTSDKVPQTTPQAATDVPDAMYVRVCFAQIAAVSVWAATL